VLSFWHGSIVCVKVDASIMISDFLSLFLVFGTVIFCKGWSSIACVIVEDSVGVSDFMFLLFEVDISCIGCDSGTCSSGFRCFLCEVFFVSF